MDYHRIIIKVGSSTLTNGTPKLSIPRIFDITRQIIQLKENGVQVALVTSGAIAAGREALSMAESTQVHAWQTNVGRHRSTAPDLVL